MMAGFASFILTKKFRRFAILELARVALDLITIWTLFNTAQFRIISTIDFND